MPMPGTMLFAGKRYERVGSYPTKVEADRTAKKMRERGHLARVNRHETGFGTHSYMLFVKYIYK